MKVKLVNVLTYVPILSYKKASLSIIPTGIRYNIKGRWQPGHQWESLTPLAEGFPWADLVKFCTVLPRCLMYKIV